MVARRRARFGNAEPLGDARSEPVVDAREVLHHPFANGLRIDLAELEVRGVDEALLLAWRQAVPEERRLPLGLDQSRQVVIFSSASPPLFAHSAAQST